MSLIACSRFRLLRRVPHGARRANLPSGALLLVAVTTMVTMLGACKRGPSLPTAPVRPSAVMTVVDTPETRQPSPDKKQVLGTGWYANVEVDGQGRIHVAWTDADVGDVMYALLDRDLAVTAVEPVEVMGAVGSYLRLAIAPGDVPVLAYYHQTDRTLRLAHRPADLEQMLAAGAEVDVSGEAPLRVVPGGRADPPGRMGPGWEGEDVTFGDNVGLAGTLVIGPKGHPHLGYYSRGDRMRYARRFAGEQAFGAKVAGRWELLDVDPEAGASYTMTTDLLLLDDGVAISFCHWNFVDAQLKVGVLRGEERAFRVLTSVLERGVDGWHSSLFPSGDGGLEVWSVGSGDHALRRAHIDLAQPAIPEERPVVLDRLGPTVVEKAKDGTVWVLARGLAIERYAEPSGLWLIALPQGNAARASRIILDEAPGSDPWIDLALLPDQRPVVVWTSADHRRMKLYVHPG